MVAKSLESCLVGFSLGLVSAMVTIEYVVVIKKTRMPSDDFMLLDSLTVPTEGSRVIHGRIYSLLNVPLARLTECYNKPKLKNFVTYLSHSSDLKKIQKHTYLGMFEFQVPGVEIFNPGGVKLNFLLKYCYHPRSLSQNFTTISDKIDSIDVRSVIDLLFKLLRLL